MTKTEARRLTRINRSHGWFRSDDYRAGYRHCPKCNAKITGHIGLFDGIHRDSLRHAAINRAIDEIMIQHLQANCDPDQVWLG